MGASSPSIAGRPVPAWIGKGLWPLILFVSLGLAFQVERSRATSPAPPAPLMQPGFGSTAKAAAVRPVRPRSPILLQLDRPMRHGDYVWNDEGVPAGRVEVLVDIASQTLHVFRSGHEIGRAVILYGTDENPTPLGNFTISEKNVDHESNIYEAAMPFMMRLTNDGIAIHGAVVEYGRASRGCIGVPDEFAAMLFEQARLGDRVRIVHGTAPASASTVS